MRDIFCAAAGGGPTHDVEHEADEAMVRSERQQDTIDQNNVLEVVNDALAVEEVHGRAEKIPIQRLGEAQAPCATRDIGNCDDFFERDNLHCRDHDYHVDVAGEDTAEEDTNHHECPDHARDEGLLLLFELGQLLLLWLCPMSARGSCQSMSSDLITFSSSFSVAQPLWVVSVLCTPGRSSSLMDS